MDFFQVKVTTQNRSVTQQQPPCLLCYVTTGLLFWNKGSGRCTYWRVSSSRTQENSLFFSLTSCGIQPSWSFCFYLLKFWGMPPCLHAPRCNGLVWNLSISDLLTVLKFSSSIFFQKQRPCYSGSSTKHPVDSSQRNLLIIPVEIIHTGFSGLSWVAGTLFRRRHRAVEEFNFSVCPCGIAV